MAFAVYLLPSCCPALQLFSCNAQLPLISLQAVADDREKRRNLLSRTPLLRIGEPIEIGNVGGGRHAELLQVTPTLRPE